MRGGAEQAGLEVLGESVVDGKSDDERCDTGGDSRNGDSGDYADDGLTAFGAEVTGRDEEFKTQLVS